MTYCYYFIFKFWPRFSLKKHWTVGFHSQDKNKKVGVLIGCVPGCVLCVSVDSAKPVSLHYVFNTVAIITRRLILN